MDERFQRTALEAWRAVWSRRRGLALVAFASCSAAAVGATVALPNLYRATATVLVERDQVSDAVVRPGVAGETETRLESITQRVLSRDRLSELIQRFGLYRSAKASLPVDAVVERMRRDIRLELKATDSGFERGATVAFALSYRGNDPATAAEVANALASFYVSENRETRERQASGTSGFLEKQLQDLKERLEERGRRIDAFKRSHMGELPEQVGANLATLERLNGELQQNRERQLRTSERREAALRAEARDDGRDSEMPAERLERLNRELARLRGRYSDDHPDVVAVKVQIRAAQADTAAAGPARSRDAAPRDPEAERRSLESDERRLRAQVSAYQVRVETAPRHEAELQQLTRDYESAKESYDTLRKREDEARLADHLEKGRMGEQFRVLDAALVPGLPDAPNRLKLVLAGLLAGLGATVVAIALKEHAD